MIENQLKVEQTKLIHLKQDRSARGRDTCIFKNTRAKGTATGNTVSRTDSVSVKAPISRTGYYTTAPRKPTADQILNNKIMTLEKRVAELETLVNKMIRGSEYEITEE
jgi:hypothetical protein